MNTIANIITSFFGDANNISLFSIFATVFVSYHVAVYTSGRQIKLQVKDLQLNSVYSPLYRILKEVSRTPSYQEALDLHEKISAILVANYELAFPQLHRLNASFGDHLSNHTDYSKTLELIVHQVSIDYSLLRKSLGYPCENTLSLFIRMTFWQKVEFLLGHLNMLGILLLVVSCAYLSNIQSPADHSVFVSVMAYFYVFLFLGNACFIIHNSSTKHEH